MPLKVSKNNTGMFAAASKFFATTPDATTVLLTTETTKDAKGKVTVTIKTFTDSKKAVAEALRISSGNPCVYTIGKAESTEFDAALPKVEAAAGAGEQPAAGAGEQPAAGADEQPAAGEGEQPAAGVDDKAKPKK